MTTLNLTRPHKTSTSSSLATPEMPKPLTLFPSGLSYKEALEVIGGLSNPSKMPGFGWSISAKACITGSKLRQIKGSTCSFCYALKGRYVFPNVQNAMERRMKGSKDPRFVEAFIVVLKALKEKGKLGGEFRWFDSGDLQSLDMLDQINQIAASLPDVKFWLPTREMRMVKEWYSKGKRPAPNLFIKISYPMIGGKFSRANLPENVSFSTVGLDDDADLYQCPARHQGNMCGTCRACWSLTAVNYPKH